MMTSRASLGLLEVLRRGGPDSRAMLIVSENTGMLWKVYTEIVTR